MWHNHKNHIGSPAGLSLISFQISGKTENHIGHQNPKNRFIFAKKPKNQMVKKEKQETATDNKTEKTKFFNAKTEKPTYKMAKTEKPKIPTPPSSI